MPDSIVVIGSINMDLVCRVRALPAAGETILGGEFVTLPGGKGANQAVAAARLVARGTRVHMVGRVGDDVFGRRLLEGLGENGVATGHVAVSRGVASGVAMILVDARGENSIVVASGANAKLTPEDVDAAEPLLRSAAAVVMQLEVPLPTIAHAIRLCRRHRVFTILDPAPVPSKGLPRAMLDVDILTPNETEARMLLAKSGGKGKPGELLRLGPRALALKLGGKGSAWIDGEGSVETFAPFKVKVKDTTAAGDAFTGALAVAWAEGRSIADAMRFANAAGAACCQHLGAQPALPTRAAVDRLLRSAKVGQSRMSRRRG
jgi:ribokinase